jgi:hypothetical protein
MQTIFQQQCWQQYFYTMRPHLKSTSTLNRNLGCVSRPFGTGALMSMNLPIHSSIQSSPSFCSFSQRMEGSGSLTVDWLSHCFHVSDLNSRFSSRLEKKNTGKRSFKRAHTTTVSPNRKLSTSDLQELSVQ